MGLAQEQQMNALVEWEQDQVLARFVIIQMDGLIPCKKGPLSSRKQVTEYLVELPKYYPGATFTVAEIAYGNDLWLTGGDEWLMLERISMLPNG